MTVSPDAAGTDTDGRPGPFARMLRDLRAAVAADLDDPGEIRAQGTVQGASISTGIEARDGHLRSPDFFDAESHPTMSFELLAVQPTGGDTYQVTGDLRIKESTRSVTFAATLDGRGPDPMGADERIGLTVTGDIDRMEFGINWDGLAGTIPVVSRTVRLEFNLALVAQAEGALQAG